MIIPNNGFIEVLQTTGGGFNNGDPIPVTEEWSDKIGCHFQKNEDNQGDYKDGEFTNYAFTVWFDAKDFDVKKVRITNKRNRVLGEFEVQSIDFLDLVNRVKITLK